MESTERAASTAPAAFRTPATKDLTMTTHPVTDSPVTETTPLTFPWPVVDPFITVVRHLDLYPRGNGNSDRRRPRGTSTKTRRGWVPAGTCTTARTCPVPRPPHRGFETITFVRWGLVDHADSFGSTGRYGHGDVQWLTAGRGMQHAEMFPLVETDTETPPNCSRSGSTRRHGTKRHTPTSR